MNYRMLLLLTFIAFPLNGAQEDPTRQITKALNITGFNGVSLSNSIHGTVTQGKEFKVELAGRAKDVAMVKATREGSRLVVEQQGCCVRSSSADSVWNLWGLFGSSVATGNSSIAITSSTGTTIVNNGNVVMIDGKPVNGGCASNFTEPVRATIQLPLVAYLAAFNSSTINATDVQADNLELCAEGAGEISLGQAICKKIDVYAGSSSKIKVDDLQAQDGAVDACLSANVSLVGRCANLLVAASYSARVLARKLVAKTVKVYACDAAQVDVQATQKLQANSTCSAVVTYCGSPRDIEKDKSYSGAIVHRWTC